MSVKAILTVIGLGALGYLAMVKGPVSASLEDGPAALRQGRYAEAIESFEKESVANPTPAVYRGWVSALRLTGAYEEALSAIQRFEEREPASPALSNLRGEILYEIGRIAEAREAFEKSVTGKAQDALTAELNLAILLHEDGKADEALTRFDRFIDVYNGSSKLSSDDLVAVAIACKYLGVTDHQLFKDSLRALDEAKVKESGEPYPVHPRG